MDRNAVERARGCMTAAGLFFQVGAEDISQAIDLGLRTDTDPVELYEFCNQRNTADKSVLAMAALIIFFLVRDGVKMKKACMSAWQVADKFHDPIIQAISNALTAAEKPKRRGKLVAGFLTSQNLQDKLSLAIYLNMAIAEDSFHARMNELRKQPDNETRIMGAAFAGAIYGLQEVNAEGKLKKK
ncbi:hypothetical protein SAMN05216582_11752 [Selenomonas ruminantium]|uniref:Triphosphoribosyl-dephospho-CoA synthase n=1 Tax=Selenomonas ruminantium TaxID=971 RepID=A0A1M6V9T3_SELRU|nr:hypothetical protein [Selenomonas ruminantium]SHK78267.1 hypothetical protein SAMN05216582_11752 [Selenomonas ruminantium]